MVLVWLSEHVFSSNPSKGRIGSIDFNVWLAQVSGLPLVGLRQESHTVRMLSLLYGGPALLLITYSYIIFEFYDLVLNLNNLDFLTQNICLSLTHLAGLYKIMNTFCRLSEVRAILTELRNVTKRYVVSERQIKTFRRGEIVTKTPLMIYATLVSVTGILGINLLAYNQAAMAGKRFPYRAKLPQWFPIKYQWAYMGVSTTIYALQIVAIDYLNITMINQICIQLKIINLSFEKFTIVHLKDRREEKWLKPKEELNSIIEHHCKLRNLQKRVETIFSVPVLIQFATSLIIFGMTGFQAIVQPSGSGSAIMIYFYSGCIFCELFLYCWFGNEVYEQSKTLATSGFNSTWFEYDHDFKKSLLVFMTNAQKPFLFTAGGFMGLSLPSFAGILSKSYTFIAVLRQIYGTH